MRAAGQAHQHFVANDDVAAGGDMRFVGCGRVPENLPVAGVDRDHVRIAGGQKNFVFGDGDAADAAVSRRLIGPDARFPNQIAGFAIKRLDDVAGARQIDDAVVHDGRGLVRAGVVHGPGPLQLQIFHVIARDLVERTVAMPLIIAPEDKPVLRRRILEHLRRDRHVVLDFARDGHTAPARQCRLAPRRSLRRRARAIRRQPRPRASRPSRPACRGAWPVAIALMSVESPGAQGLLAGCAPLRCRI